MSRPVISLGARLTVVLALSLGLLELLVRWVGYVPWNAPNTHPNEPTILEPDPVLGWRNKPGTYVFPGYTEDAPPITMTFWRDGSRATQPQEEERRRILLLGDSFTQGFAVSDWETYAWQLQQRMPSVEIRNYGTAGYSTYQALLTLEERFRSGDQPRLVAYGFLGFHEIRNIAAFPWLLVLALRSHRGGVQVPYCLLDRRGALARHPPEGYPMWPFAKSSAAVVAAELLYARIRGRNRVEQAQAVTELLLDEMRRSTEGHGSDFLVVFLTNDEQREHYRARFDAEGTRYVDCSGSFLGNMVVAGEGHPDQRAHARWAACLEQGLRALPAISDAIKVTPEAAGLASESGETQGVPAER